MNMPSELRNRLIAERRERTNDLIRQEMRNQTRRLADRNAAISKWMERFDRAKSSS